jgi:CHASE2 domain-containing sensor protein/tRNA A-37 threonylcarbamoyl transferase component Bud32
VITGVACVPIEVRLPLSVMLGDLGTPRAVALAGLCVLATFVGLTARATGILGWLERSSIDARFSLRASHSPPRGMVVVGIDDSSLAQLPRFPFSRRLDARVLTNLHRAGARLIVYDISFDRPTSEGADLALFEAAQRAAPVVFGTSLISSTGATQILGGNANIAAIGDQAAAADLLPDPDGVLRHTLAEVDGLPSIASAVARRLTGRSDGRLLRGGWIDFDGPPGTLHSLSFVNVLQDHFEPSSVRGKIVVIGATAPVLQDVHATAVGGPMSGPEVQASAIATALDGFPLRSVSAAVGLLMIVALACALPLASLRLGTLGVSVLGVLCAALWSLATQLSFDSGVVLDYVDPLAALLCAAVGTLMVGMWMDGRERQRLRNLFAADANGVVEQVLGDPQRQPIAPTAIIAGYRIEEVIARGGMGIVYRARQLALDREVAIKLISFDRVEDPVFRERFKSESRIAAAIEHANVIPVYEAGEDDGLLFIAMRLVDGFDLAQLLTRVGALSPERAVRITMQVAGALDAAHARGLVHRDVKPANVMITLDTPEHAYLTDFGVAKHLGARGRITRADRWVGTLDYLAPEQIRGEPSSASADIYSLTCMLYHCLAGRVPYPGDSEAAIMWAHVSEAPPSLTAARPGLTSELDAIVARGMAKQASKRFATAGELAQACAHAVGLSIETAAHVPPMTSARSAPPSFARTILSE